MRSDRMIPPDTAAPSHAVQPTSPSPLYKVQVTLFPQKRCLSHIYISCVTTGWQKEMALRQKWVFVSALASRFVAVKSIFGRDTEKWRRPYLDKNVSWKDLQEQMMLFISSCDAWREEDYGLLNERQSSFVWLLQIQVCFSLRNRRMRTAGVSGAKPLHIFPQNTHWQFPQLIFSHYFLHSRRRRCFNKCFGRPFDLVATHSATCRSMTLGLWTEHSLTFELTAAVKWNVKIEEILVHPGPSGSTGCLVASRWFSHSAALQARWTKTFTCADMCAWLVWLCKPKDRKGSISTDREGEYLFFFISFSLDHRKSFHCRGSNS